MSDTCQICGTRCFHPGKFEGNACQKQAEAIWEMAADGVDAECGSVSDNGLWVGIMTDLDTVNDTFGARHVVIQEDDSGFVTVTVYNTASHAAEVFGEFEADLSEESIDA